MAEALLKKEGGAAFEVFSAGTHPKGLNPFTSKVLEQASLDYTDFRSKSIDEFAGQQFDYVITVCDQAAEECPVFPGEVHRIHWSFPDPAGVAGTDVEKLAAFQTTLREMRQRISTFVLVARPSPVHR